MPVDTKEILKELWWCGVDAVRGFAAVTNTLQSHNIETPDLIIAVGKAAGDMALGARSFFQAPIETIVVTKYDHVREKLAALPNCEIFEAAHPIPDENSLIGGARVLNAVSAVMPESRLLLLVSGGASSLVEVLQPSISLDELVAQNKEFMAQGLAIGDINAKRKKLSKIKAGQLLESFKGAGADVIAISDVEGDSIDIIASGIGAYNANDGRANTIIAASNEVARTAVFDAALSQSIEIADNAECLYGDAEEIARKLFNKIDTGPAGLYIFGGEPTVLLPDNPGRGGRNQHLALLLADAIKGREDLTLLIAGTDGTDGPTEEAGAIIDGKTVDESDNVATYLTAANAGAYLDQRGALFMTGPTGTNVMDLVIAYKSN